MPLSGTSSGGDGRENTSPPHPSSEKTNAANYRRDGTVVLRQYSIVVLPRDSHFLKWSAGDVLGALYHYPLPCAFGVFLFFFMAVEYTHIMIPPAAPPYDLGFAATAFLNRFLSARPNLNRFLAALNTVFWAWLIEGRPGHHRYTLHVYIFLDMPHSCLCLRDSWNQGFDFPVGNVSFFLFYSGHVAGSVIASLDMKRMQRWKLSYIIDALNVLQVIRLLSTNGHYTIDFAVGFGAGIVFDSMAAKYENLVQ